MTPLQVAHILNLAQERWGQKHLLRVVCITGDGYFSVDGKFIEYREGMIALEQDDVVIFTLVEVISTIEIAEDDDESTTTH